MYVQLVSIHDGCMFVGKESFKLKNITALATYIEHTLRFDSFPYHSENYPIFSLKLGRRSRAMGKK